MPAYTSFTEYYAAIGYGPYLHDDEPYCIPEKLAVSVTLRSLTVQHHQLCIYLRLQRENVHFQR